MFLCLVDSVSNGKNRQAGIEKHVLIPLLSLIFFCSNITISGCDFPICKREHALRWFMLFYFWTSMVLHLQWAEKAASMSRSTMWEVNSVRKLTQVSGKGKPLEWGKGAESGSSMYMKNTSKRATYCPKGNPGLSLYASSHHTKA